jgi:hypothetical protein
MLPAGAYRYEVSRAGEAPTFEDVRLTAESVVGTRESPDGRSRHEIEAALDSDNRIVRASVRYASTMFSRNAAYEAVEENLHGTVSALAGRNEVIIKLGRFREIDIAGFVICRALILAHIVTRGQSRWTGRVAVIDPATLVVAALKQNCSSRGGNLRRWTYEARMGDTEEIELDDKGIIVGRRDNWGVNTRLLSFQPE